MSKEHITLEGLLQAARVMEEHVNATLIAAPVFHWQYLELYKECFGTEEGALTKERFDKTTDKVATIFGIDIYSAVACSPFRLYHK